MPRLAYSQQWDCLASTVGFLQSDAIFSSSLFFTMAIVKESTPYQKILGRKKHTCICLLLLLVFFRFFYFFYFYAKCILAELKIFHFQINFAIRVIEFKILAVTLELKCTHELHANNGQFKSKQKLQVEAVRTNDKTESKEPSSI